MKPNKYSLQYAKLSNLILKMSEDQQERLFNFAIDIDKEGNPINDGEKGKSFIFSTGILAGTSVTMLILFFLTAL